MRTGLAKSIVASGLPRYDGTNQRIRALVVDDMPNVVGLVSLILKRGNVDVVATAKDGLAAVHAATKLQPDLIIMDVNMPSMNGLDATMRIRRELPSARIILMSADGDELMTEVAHDCGADAFVPKDNLSTLWESQLEKMFPVPQ
jgi:DNA-binding NarL/FixJ family response regulator